MLGVVKHFVLPYNGCMNMETKVVQELRLSQKTVSLAESCTGGLISHRLTNVPGSSAVFLGSIICYSNDSKIRDLGISEEHLLTYGAVSAEVAMAMAKGIQSLFGSGLGLGITGIAGPDGGTPNKPVGLVYMAIATPESATTFKHSFTGSRTDIKQASSEKALEHIAHILNKT